MRTTDSGEGEMEQESGDGHARSLLNEKLCSKAHSVLVFYIYFIIGRPLSFLPYPLFMIDGLD